jgi:hypothetical protein
MATWEVSIVVDTNARQPVARDVEGDALERAVATAQARIDAGEHPGAKYRKGAILIQRSDQTPEAKRAKWEADFYDIDRAGRRRRRYRKPAIEKEWEEMIARDRKAETARRKAENDQYDQKRGRG